MDMRCYLRQDPLKEVKRYVISHVAEHVHSLPKKWNHIWSHVLSFHLCSAHHSYLYDTYKELTFWVVVHLYFQVTISYIDEDASLEERRAALADYAFVCRCSRCLEES